MEVVPTCDEAQLEVIILEHWFHSNTIDVLISDIIFIQALIVKIFHNSVEVD